VGIPHLFHARPRRHAGRVQRRDVCHGAWSKVWALDAKTGKQLWAYDPQVPGAWGRYACCDVANRGVAVWKGAVYVGTLDGRLVKLDAATGKPIWDINTIDRNRAYTITGAPRIVNGLVVIGNGGAEYDTRGYLTAYDADTGRQVWRFFVVPGNPKLPPENAAMTAAMKTWTTGRQGQLVGAGRWRRAVGFHGLRSRTQSALCRHGQWRSVESQSAFAGRRRQSLSLLDPRIHADTGELAWYYQTTPGDTWDFDSTSHMILADLTIDGALRKVLIQAPKNGFFYVIDRATGKLISAKPFAVMNWATGIDANGQADRESRCALQGQACGGDAAGNRRPQLAAHGVQSADGACLYSRGGRLGDLRAETESNFVYKPRAWNTGNDFAAVTQAVLDAIKSGHPPPPAVGYIKAWDPVTQKEVWHVPMNGSWNGGLLTTAGGLVFGGGADGIFGAYDAKTGEKLWSIDLKTGILAPPMSFAVGGEQYVAVLAGWGGAAGLPRSRIRRARSRNTNESGPLFVFKLGGSTASRTSAAGRRAAQRAAAANRRRRDDRERLRRLSSQLRRVPRLLRAIRRRDPRFARSADRNLEPV
jgi:quinohemoprotein ethanol dehydrogenase